jgi:GNAT superfamily N-acetyltransferase
MTNAPELSIRIATAADADTIRNLVRDAYQRWVSVIGREPLPMTIDYQKAIVEHRIDLMSTQGQTVGIVETVVRDDHLWIENIAVAPTHQGKGYGQQLLNHAECLAKTAAKTETRLLTNGAFQTNIALYHKHGYLITSTEPFMGGTTVYMKKSVHVPIDAMTYPVQMQLEAYNARDIDAFMRWWAVDCRYFLFPDTLIAVGIEEVRNRHEERFKEVNLFGALHSRSVVGNLVVDYETVTRSFPDGPGEVDVICIYEIEGGKIKTARFKIGTPRLHHA